METNKKQNADYTFSKLLKHLSYKQKKELLSFLIALEQQEKQDIQGPASAFQVIGD